MRLLRLGTAAAVAVALLGGCDSGGKDETAGTTSTSTTAPTTTTTVTPEEDRRLALAAWNAYKKAVLAKDGAAAANLVSEGTIADYETARDRALTMKRTFLQRQDVLDVVLVLALRMQLTAEELEPLNGKSLFDLAVRRGLVDEASVRNVSFDKVEITGDDAKLTPSNSRQTVKAMPMRREGGAWKVDLGEFTSEVGRQISRQASDAGKEWWQVACEIVGLQGAECDRRMEPLRP